MRALVLLLLVVIAFLVVVKFYPAASEGTLAAPAQANEEIGAAERSARSERPTPEPEPVARFLQRPAASNAVTGPPATRPEVVDPSPRPPAVEAAPQEPSLPGWLSEVEVPAVAEEGEVPIAAALVHAPQSLTRALQAYPDFPESRARMAAVFSEAVNGSASKGLSMAAGIDDAGLTARERELLQAAFKREPVQPRAPYAESPLVLAMEMSLAQRNAEVALREARFADAARMFSALLLAEIDAPWSADRPLIADWATQLERAQASHRWDPDGNWPSVVVEVQSGDSLTVVRKRYVAAHPKAYICTGLIQAANGLHGDTLQPGQKLRIPIEPVQMVVDLESRWAFYLFGNEVAAAWPIGIGRQGEETPPGNYVTGGKLEEPPWMRVGQAPVPYGDPANPLGTRWIAWFRDSVKTSYGFHGTTDPASIGHASSDGCVRFYNEDVEHLFEILPVGAPIRVRG